MKLVLFSRDLILASSVEGAARQNGLTVAQVAELSQAVAACAEDASLLLVDLRLPGLDTADLVRQVREICTARVPIVACGPHVHEARLAQAREAGCDLVVTRGQLDRDMQNIFQKLIAK